MSKGNPQLGGVALRKNGSVCLEMPKVVCQALASGARDAPRPPDPRLPGPPSDSPGNDASLDCHLDP